METGQLGQFIRNMVTDICKFLNLIFSTVINPFICFAKEIIMTILDAFDTLLGGISVIFGGLGDFRDSIQDTRAELGYRFPCDTANPF